jgi:hypothetical protein
MDMYCPRDDHIRGLDPQKAGQLRWQMTNCQCDECHKRLGRHEQREWGRVSKLAPAGGPHPTVAC